MQVFEVLTEIALGKQRASPHTKQQAFKLIRPEKQKRRDYFYESNANAQGLREGLSTGKYFLICPEMTFLVLLRKSATVGK